MRENPGSGTRSEHGQKVAGKWIARVSWSACSRQELEELQVELAGSAECRRQFIEDRIFAQSLREVFRRLDSPGLAVVQVSPHPTHASPPGPRIKEASEITFLPGSKDSVPSHSEPSRRLSLWQAVLVAGIAGVFLGYCGSRLVGSPSTASRSEVRHPKDGPAANSVDGTFVNAVFRGTVVWSASPERVFSVQQGVLEVEAPAQARPWGVLAPTGKLQVASGQSRVQFESGAGVRIKIRQGSACWVPTGGDPVELKAGSEYVHPK